MPILGFGPGCVASPMRATIKKMNLNKSADMVENLLPLHCLRGLRLGLVHGLATGLGCTLAAFDRMTGKQL